MVNTTRTYKEEIPAKKIIDEIIGGKPVAYDDVSIKGDIRIVICSNCQINENKFVIGSPIKITNSRIEGNVYFGNAIFEKEVDFQNTEFSETAIFYNARFKAYANFTESHFNGYSGFDNAYFSGYAFFSKSQFSKCASFIGSRFKYYADFGKSMFNSQAIFDRSLFMGNGLTFRDAKFKDLKSQEEVCRMTKTFLEKKGNRSEADYYFYHEMDAKRKIKGITTPMHELDKVPLPMGQNSLAIGDFEYDLDLAPTSTMSLLSSLFCKIKDHNWEKAYGFIRYNVIEYVIFKKMFGGYGVYPEWVVIWWFSIAFVFGLVYKLTQGIEGASCLWQSMHFSLLIAFARIYGNYSPKTGLFEGVVEFEMILGIIMLGVFLASITRKYMR